jgi:hypothetical protein
MVLRTSTANAVADFATLEEAASFMLDWFLEDPDDAGDGVIIEVDAEGMATLAWLLEDLYG